MKKLSFLITVALIVILSPVGKSQSMYWANADSIQDLPRLISGQPYHQDIRAVCYFDTSITSPLPLTLIVRAMRNPVIAGLPPGFSFTPFYPNPSDTIYAHYTISAPASAVDAAIANSPNGDGVYQLSYTAADLYVKNADTTSPLLAQYTWISSLTDTGSISGFYFTVMLGENTGGSDCYGLTYNGSNTSYAGLSASAGSFTISAESNYVNCPVPPTVSTSCNWLTTSVQPTGPNSADITIDYTANPLDTPRYCDLTIGNTIYHLTQIEPDCNVAMNIDSTVVGPLEGTIYVSVIAADSCYWSILNRDFCDWVDINPQSGYGTQTVEISYAGNTTGQARSCEIQFSNATLHFEQDAAVGVNENFATEFSIYPNPANDMVTISLPSLQSKEVLSIYTVAGQLLKQTQLTTQNQQVSTVGLANGIYVFTLTDANGAISYKKVVISR